MTGGVPAAGGGARFAQKDDGPAAALFIYNNNIYVRHTVVYQPKLVVDTEKENKSDIGAARAIGSFGFSAMDVLASTIAVTTVLATPVAEVATALVVGVGVDGVRCCSTHHKYCAYASTCVMWSI
ncbi:MAG TPA: hypothetical protein VM260_00875, partial [Pirellula sp.]|nr:hypothetical protein [Pirellula sp.]